MQCWVASPIRTLLTVTGVREGETERESHRWMRTGAGLRRVRKEGVGRGFKEDFKGKMITDAARKLECGRFQSGWTER